MRLGCRRWIGAPTTTTTNEELKESWVLNAYVDQSGQNFWSVSGDPLQECRSESEALFALIYGLDL